MGYRPITDFWLLARPKVKYYGAYPAGFLERARSLLGVGFNDSVLHVCSGMVRDYPFRGMGPNDQTVDIDPNLKPDFVMDVRQGLPTRIDVAGWPAILCDPPYTEEDADHYFSGRKTLPNSSKLLVDCLKAVRPGGRVGFLHYYAPRPPKKDIRLAAMVCVLAGYKNRSRIYSVFERMK